MTAAKRKDPRQHVYRVVEVWGFDDYDNSPPVKVGDQLIDKWKGRGEQSWLIMNTLSGKRIGGWVGYYLGKREDVLPDAELADPDAAGGEA